MTAILYADVVGFSRMSEADEESTFLKVRDYLDNFANIISDNNGKVIKYAGDAVLATFNSATDALICAAQVQDSTRERNKNLKENELVLFRIGLNLGDIIKDRGDVFGDGVNVAARLEALSEPGGICVSGSFYDAIGMKLPFKFEFMGEQKVKNITKPIRAHRVILGGNHKHSLNKKNYIKYFLVVFIGLVFISMATWISGKLWHSPDEPVSAVEVGNKYSIAVLPFTNLSGDKGQEYFSDGITNDIITDLSKVSNLFVIASNSVFTYKGTPVKVQKVAKDLGVSHMLEGSVQKVGKLVRVNVQLIEAETGHHLWADRFDRELSDVLQLQDEIGAHIVRTLAVQLTPDEKARLGQTEGTSPEAYDLLLRGLERLRRFTKEANIEAREYFLQAIAHDPGFARAYADVALTYGIDFLFGWQEQTNENFTKAIEYGEQALNLDPNLPEVFFGLSTLNLSMGHIDKALRYSKRSVELNPNYADGYAQLAQALVYDGRPKDGLEMIKKAKRLNPRHAFFYTWIEGHAYLFVEQYSKAVSLFKEVIDINPFFPGAHITLAIAYAELGEVDEAEWQKEEILSLIPNFSLNSKSTHAPYARHEDRARYMEGLRKAGFKD